VIAFPRRKKPGAKVKSGPVADLVPLPAERHGHELLIQWHWFFEGFTKWDIENVEPPVSGQGRANLEKTVKKCGWFDKAMTPQYQEKMRDQVHYFREAVEQRARLKVGFVRKVQVIVTWGARDGAGVPLQLRGVVVSNAMQFPRRDIAYRYGLFLAAGMDGDMREDRIREGFAFVERMQEAGRYYTDEDLRDMIEGKRDRALRQVEDLDKML
jgi:hypothetical protein